MNWKTAYINGTVNTFMSGFVRGSWV